MDSYQVVKWVHVLSSTVLFGTGLGTAYYMWMAHLGGDAKVIAAVARQVVRADWLFTGTSGVVQPASGFALVYLAGYDPWSSWLVAVYALYLIAFACWAPVVVLQIRARDLAAGAAGAAGAAPLPAAYHRVMRRWFALGWPAFIALLAAFYLMVAKPALW